jgi:hypothetical protein
MRRLLCLLLLSAFSLHAAEEYPVMVRLSAEADAKEGDTFTVPLVLPNSAKQIVVRKVPIITERDISEFYPFPATDGSGSIGCYFKLDYDGTAKLEQHTTEARDTIVIASINGRVASAMTVDKKITDGIMLVPTGFTPTEVAQLQTKYPTMGKEKDFNEQKKKAQALLKAAKKNAPKPTPKPKPTK